MQLGAGTESTVIVDIVFWAIAVSSIIAALAVVFLKDVFLKHVSLNIKSKASKKKEKGTNNISKLLLSN